MDRGRLRYDIRVKQGGAGSYILECHDRNMMVADEIYQTSCITTLKEVASDWIHRNNHMGLTQMDISVMVAADFEQCDWEWFDAQYDLEEQKEANRIQRVADMVYNSEVFGIHKQYPRPHHFGPPERIVLYPCGEPMENWRWGCIDGDPDSPKMVARSNSIFGSIDDAFDDAEKYARSIPVGSEIIVPSMPLPEKEA